MVNKKILLGISAIVLVFGLVLAGCATITGGTEPSAAAEQLAADIRY
ncbi:MAG: hypothetical protein LBH57_06035 [Treponema sp.]|jgi:uncharacterized protein YceK|nr:hypothetical protein [Treponema sp.]